MAHIVASRMVLRTSHSHMALVVVAVKEVVVEALLEQE